MHQIVLISTALLLGFALLGVMDGVYFHFWKHKLPTHPASRYEHKLHTLRAVAFPFIIYFLYAHNFGGLFLWLGAGNLPTAVRVGTNQTGMVIPGMAF